MRRLGVEVSFGRRINSSFFVLQKSKNKGIMPYKRNLKSARRNAERVLRIKRENISSSGISFKGKQGSVRA